MNISINENTFKDFCLNNIKLRRPGSTTPIPFKLYKLQEVIQEHLKENERIVVNSFRQSGMTSFFMAFAIWEAVTNASHVTYYRTHCHDHVIMSMRKIIEFLSSMEIDYIVRDKREVRLLSNNSKIIFGHPSDRKLEFCPSPFPYDLIILDEFAFHMDSSFSSRIPFLVSETNEIGSKIIINSSKNSLPFFLRSKSENSIKLFNELISQNSHLSKFFTVIDLHEPRFLFSKNHYQKFPKESMKQIEKILKPQQIV